MVIIITHLNSRSEICTADIGGQYEEMLQNLAIRLSAVIIKV